MSALPQPPHREHPSAPEDRTIRFPGRPPRSFPQYLRSIAYGKDLAEVYAKAVPQEIDFERTTLPEALTTPPEHSQQPALLFQGTTVTFKELDEMVSRFAAALKALGVKPGDKVALLLPNLVQTVVATYGSFRAGASGGFEQPLYTDRELEHQLNDSNATFLVCLDLLAPRMIALREKTGVKKIISCHIRDFLPFLLKLLFPFVKKDMHRKTPPAPHVWEFMDSIKNHAPLADLHTPAWDESAVLLYTGGTTGVSKGCNSRMPTFPVTCSNAVRGSRGLLVGKR